MRGAWYENIFCFFSAFQASGNVVSVTPLHFGDDNRTGEQYET